MTNRDKLRTLLIDVFLLEESEVSFELKRTDVRTWDSLGLVALAMGVEEVFGLHLTPAEVSEIAGVPDLMAVLVGKGIAFDD